MKKNMQLRLLSFILAFALTLGIAPKNIKAQTTDTTGSTTTLATTTLEEETNSDEGLAPTQDQVFEHKMTLTIDLTVASENPDAINEGIDRTLIPADGMITNNADVEFATGETAYDVLVRYLGDNNIDYSLPVGTFGAYIESIGGIGSGAVSISSYWSVYLNGESSPVGISSIILEEGDSLELIYFADIVETGEFTPVESVDYDVVPSDWPSFRGNDNNNAVITAGPLSPNSSETVELSYAKPFASGWVSPNQALVINDELVFIVDDVLYALNQETGEIIRELQMPAGIGFANTAALYASGRIFIPLDGSRLVSFPYANWTNQTDLASISGAWSFKDFAGNGSQVQTQLAYHEGKVILPLVNGPLIVLNAEDGSLVWRKDIEGGFYNAGGIISENHYISGTDNGELLVIDLATGETKATTKLGDQIRSSVVKDGDDYYIVANTGDSSKLFKFQVVYAGGLPTVNIAYEVSIPAGVTTPVIVNAGRVYVTNKSDTVYIVNSATGAIIRNVTYPNDFLGIQGAPLLVEDGDTSYVYFTVNDEHGRVMFFEDNPSMTENTEAKVLYQADEDLRQYSRNAIIPGSDGRLFFSLDNGYIFSLVGEEATVPTPEPSTTTNTEAPTEPTTEEPTETPSTTTTTQATTSEELASTGESSRTAGLALITLGVVLVLAMIRSRRRNQEY